MVKTLGMVVIVAIIVLMTANSSPPQPHASVVDEASLPMSTSFNALPKEFIAHCKAETVHAECHLTAILPDTDTWEGEYLSGNSGYARGLLATTINLDLNLPPPRA